MKEYPEHSYRYIVQQRDPHIEIHVTLDGIHAHHYILYINGDFACDRSDHGYGMRNMFRHDQDLKAWVEAREEESHKLYQAVKDW